MYKVFATLSSTGKVEVAPEAKKSRDATFLGRGYRLQLSLCAPIVPLNDATFLRMTRLLQLPVVPHGIARAPREATSGMY